MSQIGVACPTLYLADQEQHLLIMQQLEGKTAREAVDQGIAEGNVKKLSRIAKLIGEDVMKASKHAIAWMICCTCVDKLASSCNNMHPSLFSGSTVAKLHQNHLIHGDITTSNLLIQVCFNYSCSAGPEFIKKRKL